MCGILYARSKNGVRPVNTLILRQYNNQKDRGTLGFGLYDIKNQKLVKETKEHKIRKYVNHHSTTEMMFHHRFPTSTPNTKLGAHPFSTKDFFKDREYLLIHNGIIYNSEELAQLHSDRGIVYSSTHPDGKFNDSEALLWEVALYLEGEIEEIRAKGEVAFICLEKNTKGNKLHYFRNPSKPLIKIDTGKFFVLASEPTKNQDHIVIVPGMLFTYDYTSDLTSHKYVNIKTHSYELPATHTNRDQGLIKEAENAYSKEEINRTYEDYDDQDVADFLRMTQSRKDDQDRMLNDFPRLGSDIQAKAIKFLQEFEGSYELSVIAMRDRLDEIADFTNLLHNNYDNKKFYETEVLKAAIGMLLADPFWSSKDSETIHPYITKIKSEGKPGLSKPPIGTVQAGEPQGAPPVSELARENLTLKGMVAPSSKFTSPAVTRISTGGKHQIESRSQLAFEIPSSNEDVDFSEGIALAT